MTLPVSASYSPSDSIQCPCCHVVSTIAACHVYPAKPAQWRGKPHRRNPATVTMSDIEDAPESYEFDDMEDEGGN